LVFTGEDKGFKKNLYVIEDYGVQALMRELPGNRWKRSGLAKLLMKLRNARFPPFLCRSSVAVSPFCRCKIPLFCKNYVRKFGSVTAVNSKKTRNGNGNGNGNGVRNGNG